MKKLISTLTLVFCISIGASAQLLISGTVTPAHNNVNINNQATAYLIKKCPSGTSFTLQLLDSLVIDSIGYYEFVYPTVGNNCQILVKAKLNPASPHYANYMPSYYTGSTTGSLLWSGATAITSPGNGYSIVLAAGTNTGGPGFVGGSVLLGANKGTAAGDPLEGRTILLTDDKDVAVAHTTTDAFGKFNFSNLANGQYKLFGDSWGRDNPALLVTVDANNQSVSNIVFEENSKVFSGRYVWATNITNVNSNLSKLSVYPNPMQGEVNIAGLQDIAGDKIVTLTSVSGAVVYHNTFVAGDHVVLSTSDMASGLYLLQLKTSEGTATFKLTK